MEPSISKDTPEMRTPPLIRTLEAVPRVSGIELGVPLYTMCYNTTLIMYVYSDCVDLKALAGAMFLCQSV